jgi:hypothetical protein
MMSKKHARGGKTMNLSRTTLCLSFYALVLGCGGVSDGSDATLGSRRAPLSQSQLASIPVAPAALLESDLPGCNLSLLADQEALITLYRYSADSDLLLLLVKGEPTCIDTFGALTKAVATPDLGYDASETQRSYLAPSGSGDENENSAGDPPAGDPVPLHGPSCVHSREDGTGPVSGDPVPLAVLKLGISASK